jgi:hypothetical protein
MSFTIYIPRLVLPTNSKFFLRNCRSTGQKTTSYEIQRFIAIFYSQEPTYEPAECTSLRQTLCPF